MSVQPKLLALKMWDKPRKQGRKDAQAALSQRGCCLALQYFEETSARQKTGKSSPYAFEGTGSDKGRERSHLPAKACCYVSLRPRSYFRVDTAFWHKQQIQSTSSWENSIKIARDKTRVPSLRQVSSIPMMAHCYCRPQNTIGMGFTGISHLFLMKLFKSTQCPKPAWGCRIQLCVFALAVYLPGYFQIWY